jgi:hypothetical protein
MSSLRAAGRRNSTRPLRQSAAMFLRFRATSKIIKQPSDIDAFGTFDYFEGITPVAHISGTE